MFNMSEREYRLEVCPECKHREGDSAEKRLFQCGYCERWFCERHLEPRLAVTWDFHKIIKDKEWRDMVEEDWKKEDGHPDYAYTKERFDELKIEKEILRSKIEAFLNKSRAYRKTVAREQYATIGEHHICPRCGSNHTMTTAFREEYEAFQCLSCHYSWKEPRVSERSTFEKLPKEETEKLIEEHEIKRIKRTSTWREMRRMYERIGYVSCVIFGIVLSIIGFPFAVKYQSTIVPFLGEYQLHSITFLGSPIYTWSTWNAVVGPIEFFIAFILNTLVCFIVFLILKRF